MNETPDSAPQNPTAPRRSRRGWLAAVMALTMLLLLLAWSTATQIGFATLWRAAEWLSDGALSVRQVEGTLWQGFTLSGIDWRQGGQTLKIDRLSLSWQPSALWRRELHIQRLDLGLVRLEGGAPSSTGTPSAWPSLPANLDLPLTVRVDALSLAGVTLADGWSAYQLAGRYRYDGQRHAFELQNGRVSAGHLSARLTLDARAPFALHAAVAAQLTEGKVDMVANGTLRQFALNGVVSTPALEIQVRGAMAPFAAKPYQRIRRLALQAHGIDPHAIEPAWPKASLDLTAQIEPNDAEGGARAQLAVTNHLSGAWSDGRVPLSSLRADLSLRDAELRVNSLLARLGSGALRLNGTLARDRLLLDATLSSVNLAALHRALPLDLVSGRAQLRGSLSAARLSTQLQGRNLRAAVDVTLESAASGWHGSLHQLFLAAGGGSVNLSGQLSADQRFDLRGSLNHADPSRLLAKGPRGDLNADVSLLGSWADKPKLALNLRFTPSRWGGSPLNGQLAFDWDGLHLRQVVADVRLAANRVQAQGAYGALGDRLQLILDAPALDTLGLGFSGSARGHLDLTGEPAAPQFSVNLQARKLHLPGVFSAEALSLDGSLASGERGALHVNLSAHRAQIQNERIEALQGAVAGTLSRHSIAISGSVSAAGSMVRLALAAQGGWSAGQWRGVLERASVSGVPEMSLLAPLALELGPQRVSVGTGHFSLGAGRVDLAALNWRPQTGLQTRGRFSGLRLADFSPGLSLPVDQNLSLDGGWNVLTNERCSLELQRQSGDITVGSGKDQMALGLSAARIALDWAPGRSHLTWAAQSRLGRAEGQGSVAVVPQDLNAETPFTGSVRLDVPDLAPLSAALGSDVVLAGGLSSDLTLSGPLGNPMAFGRVSGHDLGWNDRANGVHLSAGVLIAQLNGRQLQVERLHFSAGEGELAASGNIALSGRIPTAALQLQARHVTVFDRPDRHLVLSGQGELRVTERRIALTANLTADQGRLALQQNASPVLSDDVVVRGRASAAPSAFASLPLSVTLSLDLGNQFSFSGQGLDVALSGKIEIKSQAGRVPRALGQVNLGKGRYKAYGQDLDIEAGTITFVGALENPTLNIRARRHLSPVGAGIELQGSLTAPRVRLIATDGSMSEQDKLSWLVLGHAASDNAQDSNFLALAAGSMAAGELNQKIGLFDDLGLTRKESRVALNGTVNPAEQVLTVGKQLTATFYLGYEYGLTSTAQAVKLMYLFSNNWSVILHLGTSAAAESRYTLRFD